MNTKGPFLLAAILLAHSPPWVIVFPSILIPLTSIQPARHFMSNNPVLDPISWYLHCPGCAGSSKSTLSSPQDVSWDRIALFLLSRSSTGPRRHHNVPSVPQYRSSSSAVCRSQLIFAWYSGLILGASLGGYIDSMAWYGFWKSLPLQVCTSICAPNIARLSWRVW